MFERLFGRASKVTLINPREAWDRLSTGATSGGQSAPILIDVRESWEYNGGHAKGAKSIPLSQLRQRLGEVPRDREILVICQSGHRSMNAAQMLHQQGIAQVTNVSGGTTVWRMHGLPMDEPKR